jgi:hypothetical protein
LVSENVFCIEEYINNDEKIRVNYYLGYDDGISYNDSLETHDLVWCDIDFVEDKLTYNTSKEMFKSVKSKILNSLEK